MNMETLKLEAKKRTIQGKHNFALRRTGVIPAVMYGKKTDAVSLELPEQDFNKVFKTAGESTLIDLIVDGETSKVLVADVAHDAVSDRVIHVDFHKVSLTEKLHTKIPIAFVGESLAVKGMGAVLVKSVHELDVECLPTALVHEVPADISVLLKFGDAIHFKDLVIPPGITVKHLRDTDVIATAAEPRSEEELKSLEEKPTESVEAVEVIKKEKAGGEEEEAAPEAEKKEKKEEKK
jgi:large subunit ribosomal protein L25